MTPYLSLVACSRNDEHGGNTLYRTQMFVDTFLEQCARYELPGELVLVEWNPPADRPPLAEVIRWDKQSAFTKCRIVTVPYERHIMLRYARTLPLFQMIAKNVGIRRAEGEFILATNIDILLSDELFARIARRDLRADRLYRADRFDIDSSIPILPLSERMEFAWKNLVRKNLRTSPPVIAELQMQDAPVDEILAAAAATNEFDIEEDASAPALVARESVPTLWLHMKQCGDFTLLHRDGWRKFGGYAEFETYSLHIDSIGVHSAHRAGFRETWFAPPAVCFHIEHAMGSGYVPEAEKSLFDRLDAAGIGWFDYDYIHPYLEEMRAAGNALEFNEANWGLREIELTESECSAGEINVRTVTVNEPYTKVGALKPEFDLLRQDRRIRERLTDEVAKLHGHLQISRETLQECQEKRKDEHARHLEAITKVRGDLQSLSLAHQATMGKLDEFREKLNRVRQHLGLYRRVFGWVERFGIFRA